jgi:GalNAc-alpha-(1->4)-GalNAc-alpha-(1->3)-diNAcBac-PP-undecaprenol alpha-1,4-N-acetyl-D-galactosaminyltransferase
MREKTTGFLISSLNTGGAERVVSVLANEISINRRVIVITLSKNKPHFTLNNSIKLIQLGVSNNSSNLLEAISSNINFISKLVSIIRKYKIYHLICFMPTSNLLGIISGSFFCNIKVTISERSNPLIYKYGIRGQIRKILYRFANRLVVQTDFIKQYYSKYVPKSKIQVINNPVKIINNNDFKKKKIILNVGRLDSNKNQKQLIKSFHRANNMNWKLIICGEGPSRNELENLILQLKLSEHVFLKGNVQNVNDYYSNASIFAFTSFSEGFPNVVLEAMSYGCACISTNCVVGSNDMIKNNHNGFLVEINDTDTLDTKLNQLMSNEELRQKFIKNSNIKLKKYSVTDISRKWEE